MKFTWTLIAAFAFSFSVNAQQLSHRQGQVLIEIERGSNPEGEIKLLQTRFGVDAVFGAKQVIAVPMNVWKISFDFAEINQREVLNMVRQLATVSQVQNNHLISSRKIPNDTEFDDQWQYINIGQDGGLENADLDIEDAWDLTTGGLTSTGDTIVACIIDDGLDPTHDDFGDNIWINYEEIPGNGIDDDGNGYVDDYRGWDTYNDDDDIYVGGGHGTSVAGIVGAQGNNEIGVSGVNWDVKLMIVRGGGDEANALAAYAYPYIMRQRYNQSNGDEGAFVVSTNASWGINFGQAADAPLWCNFYDSLGTVGIISCGATINGNTNVDDEGDLPTQCSSDYLISVSNINRNFEKEVLAGFGVKSIDLGAFGEGTYTPQSGNSYGTFGGTSAATPHVTGAVALLYSLPNAEIMDLAKNNPSGAALFMKDVILNSVRKDPKFTDLFKSSGVLNLKNAVELVSNIFSDCPFPFAIEVDNLNLDSTAITWEENADVNVYDLRYKHTDSIEWTLVEDVTSPLIVSGLDLCSSYEVQIQSFCDMDSMSDFSFSKLFTSMGCCEAPEAVVADNDPAIITANSIFLSWALDEDHIGYTVEYNLVGSDDVLTLETTDNFITLTDLRFCDAYEIKVIADCITGVPTPASELITAATACGRCTSLSYCPAPDAVTDGEWIESVTIDGQKAQTGENFGYVDNAGFFDIDLRVGTEIDLIVEKGFITGEEFDEWVRVWIDINVDGVFSEDEMVFDEEAATTKDVNTEITIQGDVSPGLTKMRVGMMFLSAPNACATSDDFGIFGEFEDYCVNLIGPCDYGLEITDLVPAETEASVTFTEVDTSIAYNVRYKKVEEGDDAWEVISVLDPMADITSLETCTDYVVQIRAVCLVDTSGYEAVSDTFMTLGSACMVATEDLNLSLINLSAYPNPFADVFHIKLESAYSGKVSIEVLNLSGQKFHSESTFLSTGENSITIDKSRDWEAGIYFIRVKTPNFEHSTKIIKIGG